MSVNFSILSQVANSLNAQGRASSDGLAAGSDLFGMLLSGQLGSNPTQGNTAKADKLVAKLEHKLEDTGKAPLMPENMFGLLPMQATPLQELKLSMFDANAKANLSADKINLEAEIAGLGGLKRGNKKFSLETLGSELTGLNSTQTNGKHVANAHVQLQIPVRMESGVNQSEAWNKAFAQQMLGMVQLKAESASIHVNPQHLGPIEVTLKMNQDQIQVSFVASNQIAREAIEANLPRLSQMMEQSGLAMSDAQVSYQDPKHSQQQAEQQKQSSNQMDSGFVAEIEAMQTIANQGLSTHA